MTPTSQSSANAQERFSAAQAHQDTLAVGSEQDFPPFATGMTDADAGGFTVDLWKVVAAEAGLNFNIHVRPFRQILQEFKDGKIDVLINLAQSDERRQFADFTVPHVIVHGAIFIRKGESAIHSEDDLAGRSIIVLNADLAHDYAVSKGWEKQLVLVDTAADGFHLLASGKHDALLLSKLTGVQTIQSLGLTNIEALKAKAGFSQKFAFAVRKGQSDLLAKLNEGMVLAKSNGTYDRLYEKWFGVYETREIGLRDLLAYLIPLVLVFLAVGGYFFYRRQIERRNMQLALGQSEERMRIFFDNVPVGICISTPGGRYLYVNPALPKMLGYDSGDELMDAVHATSIAEVLYEEPSQRERIVSELERGGGRWHTIENRYRCKDGRIIDTILSFGKEFDPVVGESLLYGVITDISERKRAESALRESEEKFTIAFRSSPMFISISTLTDGRYIDVNENFLKTLGYHRAEVVGNTSREIALWKNPEDRQRAADLLRKNGCLVKFEAELCKKSGKSISCEIWGEQITIGHQACVIWVTTDITERVNADAKIRKLSQAVEQSPESVVITNLNAEIEYVNEAFVQKTGYSREEVIGKNPRMLHSGKTPPSTFVSFWEAISHGRPWNGQFHNRTKDGSEYVEHAVVTPIRNTDGNITHYVAVKEDITAKQAAEEQINTLAYYDSLTELPNRRLLLDRLKHALASSTRNNRYGALLYIDLDNFKTLNDTLGHDVGDLLLQQVAKRLTTCVREGDTAARLGGDEFVVMLEDLSANIEESAAQTKIVGEKILSTLNSPYQLGKYSHHSTPSIGVTLFADQRETTEELLRRADLAMYQAKAAGRNALRFFDPEMQAVVTRRAALEADLREAVLKGQLLLHYQAQVVGTGRVTGVEVLVRWQHPQRGVVPPAEFIPLAEDTGLIVPIGHWVLKTACSQLARWATQPNMAHLTLAVNVSARQFHHKDFVDQVFAALDDTGANAQRLKLELTESLLVDDVESVIAKMAALRMSGVGFSLDDFGTGYSSLSYLKRLPLDQLKIDQSFVREILTDANDAAIAKMVVVLAESLGLSVIAEGVELEAQRDFLAYHGCHAYQGYLFCRPLPLDQFEEFASKH